ncbi:transcriptional regulator GcvA [Alkanindiges sp. WGS2144]|uniref:transcriptional regulator GcvA n=1 Tax=Alkanindiges sp. WGS2144 TaxID=3366808 RepID=UPI0037520DD8
MNSPIYLNALRAFETSARHKSFSAAAQELNVTPAAVGQLVRSLEEFLGISLFHRQKSGKNRLIPTELAERVLPDIREGFDKLSLGLEKLKENSSHGVLTVAISPAFAAKWLLPRIDRFQNLWPELDVRLDTNLKPVDFLAQKIDIGVRYGAGHWTGLEATKLMDEQIYPVCSPQFLQQRNFAFTLQDLIHETLIHDLSMEAHQGFPSWEQWLSKAGQHHVIKRGMQINNSAAVLQAAMEGHGIALARSIMAHDDIQSGRLIRLFPHITFESPLAYYVVHRIESAGLPRLLAFKEWLVAESSVWW